MAKETLLSMALDTIADDGELWGAKGLLPARVERGDSSSRVLLATGPNACGKSLVCRYAAMAVADARKRRDGVDKGEFFHIGMRLRTSGNGMIGAHTFVYGDEGDQSTGCTSLKAVDGVIMNSAKRDSRHVVALDEPEIGLSDEYALALGEKIRLFGKSLPKLCDALVIVTHSRVFASRVMALKPHRLRFGALDTAAWIASAPVEATLKELDSLAARNLETWRAVGRLLDERKKAR